MELPILVRGHYKDTVARYNIGTIFIIIERYVKLYIFDRVVIVHDRAMAICVIAINRDVSGRSHCIEKISHSFLFCHLLNWPAFRVQVLSGVINNIPFSFAKIAIVTHLRINLRTCVVPKNLLGPFLRL